MHSTTYNNQYFTKNSKFVLKITSFAVMCTDCILFLDDFNPNKVPSSNGRKFYISSPRVSESEDVSRTRDRFKKLMKGLVIGDSKPRSVITIKLQTILLYTGNFSCNCRIFSDFCVCELGVHGPEFYNSVRVRLFWAGST